MTRSGLSLFTALLVCAVGAASAQQRLNCVFPKADDTGWIGKQLIVQASKSGDTYLVADPVLFHFGQAPMKAKTVVNNAGLLILDWVLESAKDQHNVQVAKFDYRFNYNRKNGKATMRAEPHGYRNRFTERGTCEVAK